MSHSSTADLQRFVDRLNTRSILTDEEQAAILALPTQRSVVKARNDFVQVREETLYCCFIASGLAGRFGLTRQGTRQIVAFHVPGDMADLHSAIRPIGSGGLTALTATVILRVTHDAVRRLAAKFPAVAEAFWRDGIFDAAVLVEWVVNVGRRDALTRIAHVLCEMSLRYGEDREVLHNYALPLSQEQLGDATSLTAVHVNRSLKLLRELGLATFRSGEVKIADWTGLAKLGEFDADYLVADTRAERQKRLLAA